MFENYKTTFLHPYSSRAFQGSQECTLIFPKIWIQIFIKNLEMEMLKIK
jgi:hypothetical protein